MSLMDYPFGKIVLRGDFEDGADYTDYIREQPETARYAIQDRHPFLKALEGCFPTSAMLPSWWENVVTDKSLSFEKRIILQTVNGENFRDGKVSEHRIKALRAVLDVEEKKTIPSSPSIAKWLENTQWYDEYNNRGLKDASLELRITTRPEDIFYMSNGAGWTSCQHYKYGDMNSHLAGAMHEPYLAMAYLISKDEIISGGIGSRRDGTIAARSLLRMVFIEGSDIPSVLIDRAYGTDSGTIDKFLALLSEHFRQRNISHCRGRSSYDYCETFYVATPTFAIPYRVGLSYLDTMSQLTHNMRGNTSYYTLACRAHFRLQDTAVLAMPEFERINIDDYDENEEDEEF